MSVSWLCKHAPRPQARARLFCFSSAGVGSSAYRLWPGALPVSLEVCPVQLPGRENRLRETPLANIAALVDALVPALLPHLDLPFAFFGHSMGAVLASEVARALAGAGASLPKHIIVSGRRPPHMPSAEPPFHALPDPEFVAEVNRRYGGIPAEVMQQKDLLALLLPCLRADITALETHLPVRRPPLPCPISAFGGADDRLTPREHLEAWRGETSEAFQVRVYPGDHFYLNPRRAQVLADVSATLAPILSTPTLWSARA
jgi:medium-chain acyl-[acyl-carrier-protein] hydrolase